MATKKSKKVGYLLAFFIGGLGIHHFYYRNYVRGVIYLLFCWTYVPILLGWIDMFFINKWNSRINALEQLDNKKSIKVDSSISQHEKQINSFTDKKKMKQEDIKSEFIIEDTKQNKVGNKFDSLSKEFVFYSEDDIILSKYQKLKTPSEIKNQIEAIQFPKKDLRQSDSITIEFSYSSSHINFARDSIKYAQKKEVESPEIPLQVYWTTFSNLNNKQLKWYFYWREQSLKGNYLNVDLSYIILFVYELINYTFNQKAAFNVSMMVRLYDNYVERHPTLKNYLPQWTSDMLYELGEVELAKEYHQEKVYLPPLYIQLREKKEFLEKISITTWKPFIRNYRETAFFLNNRNKIYKTFKESIPVISEHYKRQGKELEDVWFETRMERKVRSLFASAVVAREVESIHVHTVRYNQTETLYEEITTLFKLAENMTRALYGEKRKIKMEDGILPDDFEDKLMERLNQAKKTNERFKVVQKRSSTEVGDAIPKAPDTKSEATQHKLNIEFNVKEIEKLKEDSNQLINAFNSSSYTEEKDELVSSATESSIGDPTQHIGNQPSLNILTEEIDNSDSQKKIIPSVDAKDNTKPLLGGFSVEEDIKKTGTSAEISTQVESENHSSLDGLFEEFDGGEEELSEFIESLSKLELEFFCQFENGNYIKSKAKHFVKENGFMLGMFLNTLNEKANGCLGDNIVEEHEDVISVYEEYEQVISLAKERSIVEN